MDHDKYGTDAVTSPELRAALEARVAIAEPTAERTAEPDTPASPPPPADPVPTSPAPVSPDVAAAVERARAEALAAMRRKAGHVKELRGVGALKRWG